MKSNNARAEKIHRKQEYVRVNFDKVLSGSVAIKMVQVTKREKLNSHVNMISYCGFLTPLKKLKIVICRYIAGIESESVSSALNSSVLLWLAIESSVVVCVKNIAPMISAPNKMASLIEITISDSISLVFKSHDPATFSSVGKKKPKPRTVRNEIDARANDAELSESTIKWPTKEKYINEAVKSPNLENMSGMAILKTSINRPPIKILTAG
ncbi:UNVERIFIED_ORG: hypothetical protein J2Y76_000661 [Pseudomonas reinekei]|uniref:hypothetical protein n=1 Tax=Pseudomonas laurylsulfatiphila TaxID=2011015 RepID=UPI003D1B07AE|nr:hypothetical protein [Pseudomonas reinekei]